MHSFSPAKNMRGIFFFYYFEDTRLCSKTTTFQTLLLERMLASGLKSKPAIISSPLTFCPTAMFLVHYANVLHADYVGPKPSSVAAVTPVSYLGSSAV